MRFIVLLFFASFTWLQALAQISSEQRMAAQLQQSISMLEKQLANAKNNHADAGKIKEISDQLKSARLALSSIAQLSAAPANQSMADAGAKWTGYVRAV